MVTFDARAVRDAVRRATAQQRDLASEVADANKRSALSSADDRARRVAEDLAHLTALDRDLIAAATGEKIPAEPRSYARPLSAFAMQVAVDRRSGALPDGQPINEDYLVATGEHLRALGVPANPFSGPALERAVAFLREHPVRTGA